MNQPVSVLSGSVTRSNQFYPLNLCTMSSFAALVWLAVKANLQPIKFRDFAPPDQKPKPPAFGQCSKDFLNKRGILNLIFRQPSGPSTLIGYCILLQKTGAYLFRNKASAPPP